MIGSAVIYCRVSDPKQKTQGDGLNSQETRCREYARYKGYTVVHVFKDDISGAGLNRPALKEMLVFLRTHRRTPHVVVIDDISRLARGIQTHHQLRGAIAAAGGILESPSIEFGADSDSILVENLLASVSQHQREKNGEQVKNRMRARIMNGYWVFQAPIGYRFQQVAGHNKLLVRNEPLASIVQEALEGYACGRFELQAEVQRFLEAQPLFRRDAKGRVHSQRVYEMLRQAVYAGYVHAPDWNVPLRKGHHQALISYETFQKIQDRLAGITKAPARKDLHQDFPLRGFVSCADCDNPLTAGWTRGRSALYPYYYCFAKGCPGHGKAIRRDLIEGEFEALLHRLQPTENLFRAARAMFEELWDRRIANGEQRRSALQSELKLVCKQVEQFLDRIADADMPSVIAAYENRIRDLESRRLLLEEKVATEGRPLRSFNDTLRTAFEFLGNPWKLWASGRFEDKRAVLRLAFAERLIYRRGSGFRTADLALPFKLLGELSVGKMDMVGGAGFEPATPAV
jgi:site-specific DNA recombinase